MKTMTMVALALCACAADPHEKMRADAKQVDALAHDLAQEAQSYCAAAPWVAPAACGEGLSSHRASVTVRVEALEQLAEAMDRHLAGVGSGALADLGCGVPSMQAEMSRYAATACSAADAAPTEADAVAHCAALTDTAAQLHARANEVLSATRESVRVGGSGRMPGHLQPIPSGEHAWPWATEGEPVPVALCGG